MEDAERENARLKQEVDMGESTFMFQNFVYYYKRNFKASLLKSKKTFFGRVLLLEEC